MLYSEFFSGFRQRVTQEMNDDLTRPITEEEIQAAMFDMGPHCSPRSAGLTAVFNQNFWDDFKADIMQEIEGFLT